MVTMNMLILSAVLTLIAPPHSASQAANEEGPRPDRWRGLVLDQSTPTDARNILGDPASDRPDRLFIYHVNKWFQPGLNKKNLRKIAFKGVEGFDKVDLYFREDKLVVIQLDPYQKIAPTALSNIYGTQFNPFVSGFEEAMSPQQFERNQGKVYPKTFPDSYSLVGLSSSSVIAAIVENSGFGSILKQGLGVRDTAGAGFPGTVRQIQLISRTLENRQGADLLK
jgi:hypothetical protein